MAEDQVKNDIATRDRFPSNSYTKFKPKGQVQAGTNEETVAKVTKGTVKEKKKSLGEKIADAFIAADGKDVKEYLLFDLLIPGAKNMIESVIHMILYSDRPNGRVIRNNGESRIRRVDYNSIYDERRRRGAAIGERSRAASTDLYFENRNDAEEVLVAVEDRIEQYGFATVKYFYSLADLDTDFTQTKWGWRDVRGADIIQMRDGTYLLRMPRPEVVA